MYPLLPPMFASFKIKEKSFYFEKFFFNSKSDRNSVYWTDFQYRNIFSDRNSVEATEFRSLIFFLKKGTRGPKTIFLMAWVPSTKVHARVVLVNMFVKIFFHTDKTM
jgi:hypothetical protein